jgi:uncharacterized membrane protein
MLRRVVWKTSIDNSISLLQNVARRRQDIAVYCASYNAQGKVQNVTSLVRCVLLAAMNRKSNVFWNLAHCSFVYICQRFWRTFCHHLITCTIIVWLRQDWHSVGLYYSLPVNSVIIVGRPFSDFALKPEVSIRRSFVDSKAIDTRTRDHQRMNGKFSLLQAYHELDTG